MMHPDLSEGVTLNGSRSVAKLQTALTYGKSMAPEKRERSWIRCGEKAQPLDGAEKELAGTASA